MNEKDTPSKDGRWPFDPMQPGDHEPVRMPEELERVQKPNQGKASHEDGTRRG